MRIREPKSTALIFQTGKVVITGAKSENDARVAARKYARIIQKLGFPAQFADFKIQNIVGSCDVGFPLRLEGLAFEYPEKSSYEPELFPGLIFRFKSPNITALVFVSGKIVLTGAKTKEEIDTAFNRTLYPILLSYKKDIGDYEEDDENGDQDDYDHLLDDNDNDNDNDNGNGNRNRNGPNENFGDLIGDDSDGELDFGSNMAQNMNVNMNINSKNNANNINDDPQMMAPPDSGAINDNVNNNSSNNSNSNNANSGNNGSGNLVLQSDPFGDVDDDDFDDFDDDDDEVLDL